MESIVSSKWLLENLNHPDLVILDATLPNQRTKFNDDIQQLQIKDARFFDLKNKFSDTSGAYPTTYPSVSQFEEEAQKLGINQNSMIVVYDINGIYSSPRVWWLFKTMGHQNIAVLNGGFPDWSKNRYPTEKATTRKNTQGNFKAQHSLKKVRFFNDIYNNLTSKKELIVDVRSEERFNCLVDEPKAGLRKGTIPTSVNLPYTNVVKNGRFKSKEERTLLFKPFNSEKRPITFSCGSGITACVVLLAADGILNNNLATYDGSWTEWGDRYKE